MRRLLAAAPFPALALLCGAVALLAWLPEARAEARTWDFRVMLDRKEIGTHRFVLRDAGTSRELRSAAMFDVRFLFVSAWRYEHTALERWREGCLVSLESRTDTNGVQESVSAALDDGRLVVEGSSGRAAHAGCVMSFAYWNPRILQARRLLNGQTGELVPVTVSPGAEETIVVGGERRNARRNRIAGPGLQIDVWYSDGGQWLALEAPTSGGRLLRYELR